MTAPRIDSVPQTPHHPEKWRARCGWCALALAVWLVAPLAAPAAEPRVYIWRDAQGVVRFSTVTPDAKR